MSNNGFRRLAVVTCFVGCSAGSVPAAGAAAATGLPRWTALTEGDLAGGRVVQDAVVLLCAAVLCASLVWLGVSGIVCAADLAGTGAVTARGGLLRPRFMRVAAAFALGSAVATGVPAAGADPRPELPRGLAGLPVPDRTYGAVPVAHATHRVLPGESLWSITAQRLPRPSRPEAVAHAWPRVYGLNRDRIGPDPDLIQPGTVLRLPSWATTDRGAAR